MKALGRGTRLLGRWLALVVLLVSCGIAGDEQPKKVAKGTVSEASARAAMVLAQQRAAGPAFDVADRGADLVASNAPHDFTATFTREGFSLSDRITVDEAPSWKASIAVDVFGCAGDVRAVGADEPTAADETQRNLVEQGHGAFTAWYLNGPLGLEQGFDIAERPACLARASTLTIGMSVAGLTPRLDAHGAVELRNGAGAIVLRYAGLHVADASGDTVSAVLRVADGRVHIDVEAAGAAFPLAVDPVWAQQAKLTADNAATGDEFGARVAVSGDTVLVGAPRHNGGPQDSGAAYVFVRGSDGWTQQAELNASDAGSNDGFGISVALEGDTAIIGSYGDNDGAQDTGSAYVFVRSGTTWTEQAKLNASDASESAQLGSAVSLSGDTAIVAARFDDDAGYLSGSAYVFVRSGTTWTEEAKLTASDAKALQIFGAAVAVHGDTALVGCTHDGAGAVDGGAVYVFQRSGTSWSEQAKLLAGDAGAFDYLGRSVTLQGDTAIAGAANDDVGDNSGAAYVFVRSGTTWSQTAKLTASDAAAGDWFGQSVSLSGNTVVVSASQDDDGAQDAGSAYVFVGSGSTWTETGKLNPSDPGYHDRFGWSASLSGDTAVVGAFWDNGTGADSGSAYVFVIGGGLGETCAADAACLSGFCRDGVCCDSDCGGGSTSDCQSCLAAQTAQMTDGICDTIEAAASYSCRTGSGDSCDADEICDGTETTCPDDVVAASGTVCNAGSGDSCDPDEVCSGVAGETCPSDVWSDDGTPCDDGTSRVCESGICAEPMGGSGGDTTGAGGQSAGTGGQAMGSGGGGHDVTPGDPGGEGSCQLAAAPPRRSPSGWLLAWLVALVAARRRSGHGV